MPFRREVSLRTQPRSRQPGTVANAQLCSSSVRSLPLAARSSHRGGIGDVIAAKEANPRLSVWLWLAGGLAHPFSASVLAAWRRGRGVGSGCYHYLRQRGQLRIRWIPGRGGRLASGLPGRWADRRGLRGSAGRDSPKKSKSPSEAHATCGSAVPGGDSARPRGLIKQYGIAALAARPVGAASPCGLPLMTVCPSESCRLWSGPVNEQAAVRSVPALRAPRLQPALPRAPEATRVLEVARLVAMFSDLDPGEILAPVVDLDVVKLDVGLIRAEPVVMPPAVSSTR